MKWVRALATGAVVVGVACPRAAAAECGPVAPPSCGPGGEAATGQPVNDPLFSRQWGLAQIRVAEAWARGFRGRGAIIAVLDSGIDLHHPDLVPAMLEGVDMHARVTGERDCPPGPDDQYGHGTHIAGIAAARGDNGIGVAGAAPSASILPIKVGDENAILFEAVLAGIRYAADAGADVANLSLSATETGLGVPLSALESSVEEAVEYAWERGTLVVAAAGNDTGALCKYPAAAAKALCVTSSDREGLPPSYSNAGFDADATRSVRAPGGGGAPGTVDLCEDNILSTVWPRGDLGSCRTGPGYGTGAGTSQAAPHVAGLAALLSAAGLTAAEIVARLRETASPPLSIVDAAAATAGLPVPAPPPPRAAAPAPGSPAPSAAERRCAQARATVTLRTRELRSAQRRARRARTRAARRRAAKLVTRRKAERRRAVRDVSRRCP